MGVEYFDFVKEKTFIKMKLTALGLSGFGLHLFILKVISGNLLVSLAR